MRPLRALLFVLAGFLLGALNGVARADHQVTFSIAGYGELSKYNPAIQELRLTGVFRWHCALDAGAPDGCADAIEALNEYSQRYGVLMRYDPIGTALWSSGGTAFQLGNTYHGAGGIWAIGFVDNFPGNPQIVVDNASMASWSQRSRLEVWLHEMLHLLANSGEGYKEDYVYGTTSCAPIDDGGVFVGFHRSVMNCGLLNSQVLDRWTDYIWAYSQYPAPVAGASLQGGVVYYAATTPTATRVAILGDSGAGEYVIGYTGACTAAGFVCGSFRLPLLVAGTRVLVKSENAISWAYAFTEREAGVVR